MKLNVRTGVFVLCVGSLLWGSGYLHAQRSSTRKG